MRICSVIKEKVQSSKTERDLYDDSDGAHLASYRIEFQTEDEAK